jgi:hypothetical protein
VIGEMEGQSKQHVNKQGTMHMTWDSLLAVVGLQWGCVGMLVWGAPNLVRLPYPDCVVPLLGALVAGVGLAMEMGEHGNLRLFGSLIIVTGISYAFNSYLSCRYCGYVTDDRPGHRSTTVWKCPLRSGGILQVVDVLPDMGHASTADAEEYRLRAVRLGHSIMGGEWTSPAAVAGAPIFSAFHLQAAAAALFGDPDHDTSTKKSLHIGLGVGGSVTLLQNLGYSCDCVELHPQMVHVAREFFRLNGTACLIGDANEMVHRIPLDVYDAIIIDIFSGDADEVAHSGNGEFFGALSRSMMQARDAVLVVNYFGLEGQRLHMLHKSIQASFSAVRVFREERDERAISNFVLVASNRRGFSAAQPSSLLESEPYRAVFAEFRDHLVDILEGRELTSKGLVSTCNDSQSVPELVRSWRCLAQEQLAFAGAHWRAMRSQFFS